ELFHGIIVLSSFEFSQGAEHAVRGEAIETRSLPTLTHVLPPISTSRFSHLCRAPPGGSVHSQLPIAAFYVDHSHVPRACASYPSWVAAYPSAPLPERDKRTSIEFYGAQLR